MSLGGNQVGGGGEITTNKHPDIYLDPNRVSRVGACGTQLSNSIPRLQADQSTVV